MSTRRTSGRRSTTAVVPSVPGPKANLKTTGRNPPATAAAKKREVKEAKPTKQLSTEEEEEEDKENQKAAVLDDFINMVRDKCVLTERWVVYDPQYDPARDKKAALVVEMDKTVEGELRLKRCVKIFDDRTYCVLIDNVDMTHEFDHINESKKLDTTHDSDKLMHALMTKKVCQGLRTYDTKSAVLAQGNLPVKQRGKLWYAKDCTVIVQKAFMGNSCNGCMKVRNQIRRCLQNDSRKKSRRPAMKHVRSSFGKALYSLLNDFSGRGPIPPSQFTRDQMVFDDKLGIHISYDLHQRLFIAATMPPPPMPLKSRNRKNRRGSGRGGRFPPPSSTITSQEYPIQQFITEDGQVCYVALDPMSMGGVGDVQYGMPMMVEKYEPEMGEYMTVNDNGNIVIQNVQGQEFQLAEGQEYELIGEAPSGGSIEPIEILPADNQQIQIIEVDDATMQQIEVHNSTENMQIAAVDPNDPNLSHLFRAFQSQIQGLAL